MHFFADVILFMLAVLTCIFELDVSMVPQPTTLPKVHDTPRT